VAYMVGKAAHLIKCFYLCNVNRQTFSIISFYLNYVNNAYTVITNFAMILPWLCYYAWYSMSLTLLQSYHGLYWIWYLGPFLFYLFIYLFYTTQWGRDDAFLVTPYFLC